MLDALQNIAGALVAIVVVAVWAFLTRTRYGLIVRAGSEDSEMVEALGINVRQAFTVVFGIGVGVTHSEPRETEVAGSFATGSSGRCRPGSGHRPDWIGMVKHRDA